MMSRLVLLSLFMSCLLLSHAADSRRPAFDFMYQFGDSLSDTGNLVIENPVGAAAFARFPYGETLGRPTGRCSDGLLMVDHFSRHFHLPLLAPYLDKGGNFSHGANFAVAGAAALDSPVLLNMGVINPATDSSLSVQLDWFKSHLSAMCGSSSECRRERAGNALMLIEIGGNDYNYALLEQKSIADVQAMVPQVVAAITKATRELISLGAKQVFIPGNFPIGCLPVYLATFQTEDFTKYDRMHCLKDLNSFARFHNDALQRAIKELQEEYPDVKIVYGDYYSALTWLLENAGSIGFDTGHLQTACCGSAVNSYDFDLRNMCGNKGVQVCMNPNQHISWDGIHMTQRAYAYMAEWLLRNNVKNCN